MRRARAVASMRTLDEHSERVSGFRPDSRNRRLFSLVLPRSGVMQADPRRNRKTISGWRLTQTPSTTTETLDEHGERVSGFGPDPHKPWAVLVSIAPVRRRLYFETPSSTNYTDPTELPSSIRLDSVGCQHSLKEYCHLNIPRIPRGLRGRKRHNCGPSRYRAACDGYAASR